MMDFMHSFQPRQKKVHLSTQRKIKVLLALNSQSQKCFYTGSDSERQIVHDHESKLMDFLRCVQLHVERLRELSKVLMHPALKENIESAADLTGLVDEMLSTHCIVYRDVFRGADDSLKILSLCLEAYISYSLLINLEKSSFQKISDKFRDVPFEDELLQEPILYISKCKTLLEKLCLAQPQEMYHNTLKDVEVTWNNIKSNLFVRENAERMLQIQRTLLRREPKILNPKRVLVKEGILYKINEKGTNMKPRMFFLFNDAFLCCKIMSKDVECWYEKNSLLFCAFLPLKMCAVMLIMGSSNQSTLFKVTCGTLSYLLISKIPGEAHCWFQELQKAIRSSQKLHGELKLKLSRKKNKVLKQKISPFLNQPP